MCVLILQPKPHVCGRGKHILQDQQLAVWYRGALRKEKKNHICLSVYRLAPLLSPFLHLSCSEHSKQFCPARRQMHRSTLRTRGEGLATAAGWTIGTMVPIPRRSAWLPANDWLSG